jgi:uncharacterized delta-60 repeat protein
MRRGLLSPGQSEAQRKNRAQLTFERLEGRTLLSAGVLDSSFGTQGEVRTDFGGNMDFANRAILQPDGKIIAVGLSRTRDNSEYDAALARYNPDGSLDSTFGNGGLVQSKLGTASDVALQTDGKILVAANSFAFAAARYNPDGSLDTSFGSGGTAITAGPWNTQVKTVVIQSDGKILLGGSVQRLFSVSPSHGMLVRYSPDGSLDTSFGPFLAPGSPPGGMFSNGEVEIPQGSQGSSADCLALEPDGKILVGGVIDGGVLRLNADGSLDTSFGSGGLAPVGSAALTVSALLVQPDGKILAAGPAQGHFALVRLNLDGSLDGSFNNFGTFAAEVSSNVVTPTTLVIQGGQILAGGPARPNGLVDENFVVARYNADGSLDTRYGIGGTFAGTLGSPSDARDVIFQSNGQIVVAGVAGTTSGGATNNDFLVGRFTVTPETLTGTENQRFVQQLYLDLLGRPVDPSGSSFFTGLLDQGQATSSQVVLGIEGSAEYRALVVTNLYNLLLNRVVDATGLQAWTSFLAAGGTSQQLEAALLGSDEYFALHGSTSQGLMAGVYNDVLHRSPDPSGSQSWGQALSNGLSHEGFALGILASPEAATLATQTLYHRFLHRSPDPSGLSVYSNALVMGVPSEALVPVILSSSEYAAALFPAG